MKFNPKDYGASNSNGVWNGNAKRIVDVATTSGSAVLTSTGGFAGAVAGQTIWVSGALQQTTIAHVTSANQVEATVNATLTGTAFECVFGGDDTGAFQAAFAAATGVANLRTTMEPPNARCVLTQRFYNYPSGSYAPNLVGEDGGTCEMYVSPNIPLPEGAGEGILINSTGGSNRFADFSVICPMVNFVGVGDYQAMVRQDGNGTRQDSFQVVNFCAANPKSAYVRTFDGILMLASFTKVYTSFDAAGSLAQLGDFENLGWIVNNQGGLMVCPFFSNLRSSLDVTNTPTRQGIGGGAGLQVVGGYFDENGGPLLAPNINLHGGGALEIFGTMVWTSSAPGNYAVAVDGTSRLWTHGGVLSPYAINTSGARALNIAAGGIVRGQGTTFCCTDNASNVSINNNGLFVDIGGCNFRNIYPGPAPLEVLPRAALAHPTSNLRIANQLGS